MRFTKDDYMRQHKADQRPPDITDDETGAQVWLSTNARGAACAVGWMGRQERPGLNYQYRSAEHRLEHVTKWINDRKKSKEIREQWRGTFKTQKQTAVQALKVGDILTYSWGYDQTNVNAFQVTRKSKTGKTFYIREIAVKGVEDTGGFMCEQVKPVKDASISGKPEIKKQSLSMDHGGLSVWDGESSLYCSWYA